MQKKLFLSLIVLFVGFTTVKSQESKFNVGGDIVSRYVWRGVDFGSSPSIQPYFEYAHKSGFTLGYWGAMSTKGDYNEVDLYAKYKFKGFSIIATDYFFPVSTKPERKQQKYLVYDNDTTGHLLEGTLQWDGPENFPITILAATYFYGADKNEKGDNNFSTYAEVSYAFNTKAGAISPFIGFTPDKGLYGSEMGVVNLGITGKKTIKVTESFEIPVKASVISNPQTSNVYFVLGITL